MYKKPIVAFLRKSIMEGALNEGSACGKFRLDSPVRE